MNRTPRPTNVNRLEERNADLLVENKKLIELLHFGCQDQTMISVIHKAKVNKEQTLKERT